VEIVPDAPVATAPVGPVAAVASALQPTLAELHEMLTRAGAAHHIDVDLLASVVHAESGGQVKAVSRTGARGLMQLMPGTASELGVKDAFVADQNVEGGTKYLDALLTRYHDNIALALAAYNAGPGAVDKFHGVPPFRETRAYVSRVIREFNRRKTVLLAQAK
jgi:soluble lytic murein transglycosylase-like protein